MSLDTKFEQNKEEMKNTKEVMLRTKEDIAKMMADIRAEIAKDRSKTDGLEQRMDETITDAKFWLEKYTKAYKENDAKIGEIQGEFSGRIETIFYQLSRRVTNDDMQKNMEKLSDMLYIKFQQVEENKQTLRDMLTY